MMAWWLVLLLWARSCQGFVTGSEPVRHCEPIKIEMCKNLGYKMTGMPNLVGHTLQSDAEFQLTTFTPLVQYGCSSQLKFFLCSVYAPMCTDKVEDSIGPCKPLCEAVRSRCEPVLKEFGFPWPGTLNCSKFHPENNQHHMCMDGPEEETVLPKSKHETLRIPSIPRVPSFPASTSPNQISVTHMSRTMCSEYKQPDKFYYINRTERCAQKCDADISFSHEDKKFAEIWMVVWAVPCFLSSLFTLATFLLDTGRFQYPERPIIFLSLCYNIVSVGFIIRLISGKTDVSCHMDAQHSVNILIQEGLSNSTCAMVFLLLYYFMAASAVWWVILTVTWFLAAGLKWGADSLAKYSSWFQLAAWGIPTAKTIAILVMRDVDADELTGTCYVGNQNIQSLLTFVLVPQLIYLVIGASFLLAGFLAMFRIRRRQRSSVEAGYKIDSLEVLMVRIGIFSVLYTVPAACVLSSLFYEYNFRESWLKDPSFRPKMEVFMLKIFMSLVVGITTGMWIWSGKTISTWKNVCRRMTARKQPLPPYLQQPQVIRLDTRRKHHCKNGESVL